MDGLEDFYETMCRISPVGLFRTDETGRITYVNQKYEDIAQISRGQILGVGWFDAVHLDDVKKVSNTWYNAIENNLDWNLEFRFRSKDKQVTWVLGQAAKINGGGKGYVGTLTNISKKKQLLDELMTIRTEMFAL